jgi:hypothetical protein
MRELRWRLLFNKRRAVELHELSGRALPCIYRSLCLDRLRKLFARILSADRWIIKLHRMFGWILLRDHWLDCSDSCLCSWKIFGCFGKCVFKLLDGVLFR